jgi:hypothetical protein
MSFCLRHKPFGFFLGGRLEFLSLPLFFSGGSGVLSEVNSGGDVWNFYFLLVGEGGSEISGIPPHSQVYLNGTALI